MILLLLVMCGLPLPPTTYPTTAQGHEEAFTRPRAKDQCRFSQATFAEARGKGRGSPKSVSEQLQARRVFYGAEHLAAISFLALVAFVSF